MDLHTPLNPKPDLFQVTQVPSFYEFHVPNCPHVHALLSYYGDRNKLLRDTGLEHETMFYGNWEKQ